MRIIRLALAMPLVLALGFPIAGHTHEHPSGELDLFLSMEALRASNDVRQDDDDSWFNADVLFTLNRHRFRVLAEFLATAEEHDLERFQVGFEIIPDTVLWFGRFHQPSSAWNTEHHHGRYLQTAITRPSIERWEDEHGLIPQHNVGTLLESRLAFGKSGAIQLSAGFGAGPSLQREGLHSIELLDSTPGRHRLSATARIAWLPDYTGPSSVGLLLGHHDIYVGEPVLPLMQQTRSLTLNLRGGFADWSREPWHVMSVIYLIELDFQGTVRNEHFTAAYVQIERLLSQRMTAFGRVELSDDMRQSRYVNQFDDHDGNIDTALRRNALGLRWDFMYRQALTIELSQAASFNQRSNEVRLQWSAVVQ